MTKEKLIIRQYRISKDDDKIVKKNKEKFNGEASFIRSLIRAYAKRPF